MNRAPLLVLLAVAASACGAVDPVEPAQEQNATASTTQSRLTATNAVLTQHNDNARTGAYVGETTLTQGNVRSRGMTLAHSVKVDGNIQVQALYTPANTVTSYNTIYTATGANKVYVINADTGTSWNITLTDPVDHAACIAGGTVSPDLRCNPKGVTSTPVIDPATGLLYVLYGTFNSIPNPAPDRITASGIQDYATPCQASKANWWRECGGMNVADRTNVRAAFMNWWSQLKAEWYIAAIDVNAKAVKKVTHVGAYSQGVTFEAKAQRSRPGLLLSGGNVYIAFGASSETQSLFHGWIMSYDTATLSQQASYVTTPSLLNDMAGDCTSCGEGAGIWQSGGGITADAQGNLYFATGNGPMGAAARAAGNQANSIVTLDSQLHARVGAPIYSPKCAPEEIPPGAIDCTAENATYQSQYLDRNDLDLGAGGTLLLNQGSSTRLLGGGKTGVFYTLSPSTMRPVQRPFRAFENQYVPVPQGGGEYDLGRAPHVHGTPAYWRAPGLNGRVFAWSEKDYLRAFEYDVTAGVLTPSPVAVGTELADSVLMPGGMLSVSSNQTAVGSGIVWATLPSALGGQLYAYNAENLQLLWYTGLWSSQSVTPGMLDAAKWAAPTIVDGKVIVGSSQRGGGPSAELQIYTLGPVATYGSTPPFAPAGGSIAASDEFSPTVVQASGAGGRIATVFVGSDGAVYAGGEQDNRAWNAPVPLTRPNFAPPGAGVALGWEQLAPPANGPNGAPATTAKRLNAFVVDNTGTLQVFTDSIATVGGAQAWSAPKAITSPISARLRPGAALATGVQGVSAANVLDVFVIDESGFLDVAWRVAEGTFHALAPISGGFAPGGQIATGRQNANALDVFSINASGTLEERWLLDTYVGNWQGGTIGTALFTPGGGVATGAQGANTLDVFSVDTSGNLRVTWLVGSGTSTGWPGPQIINRPSASPAALTPGTALATAVRAPYVNAPTAQNELDVFAVDTSGVPTFSKLLGEGAAGWTGPTQMPHDGSSLGVSIVGSSVAAAKQLPWVTDVVVTGKLGVFGYYALHDGAWNEFPIY